MLELRPKGSLGGAGMTRRSLQVDGTVHDNRRQEGLARSGD